jgi:hypothetical protein
MGLISLALCVIVVLRYISKGLLFSTIVALLNAGLNCVSLVQLYENKNHPLLKLWSRLNLTSTLIGMILLISSFVMKS